MKAYSITLDYISSKNKVLFTILTIGFGITLPRIFHLFDLGSMFLPMFIPIAVTSFILPLHYIITASLITPMLSTALFGMPPLTVSTIMCAQLTLIGSIQLILRQTRIAKWQITPIAIIGERLLTLIASYILPSLKISSQAILSSYPGILIIIVAGIITSKVIDAD